VGILAAHYDRNRKGEYEKTNHSERPPTSIGVGHLGMNAMDIPRGGELAISPRQETRKAEKTIRPRGAGRSSM